MKTKSKPYPNVPPMCGDLDDQLAPVGTGNPENAGEDGIAPWGGPDIGK